jgi:hypothetical protein
MATVMIFNKHQDVSEVPSEVLLGTFLVSFSLVVLLLVVIYLISRKRKGN